MAVQKVFRAVKDPGATITMLAEDRTTSSVTAQMSVGEPVKKGGTGSNFATPLATGDPEVGTDEMVGIVRKQSTETSTADGVVEVVTLLPYQTVLRAKATTAANINTVAKINALVGDWVGGEVTALTGTNGDFTINEDEGDDPNVHAFKILDGDSVKGTLDFIVHSHATSAGTTI